MIHAKGVQHISPTNLDFMHLQRMWEAISDSKPQTLHHVASPTLISYKQMAQIIVKMPRIIVESCLISQWLSTMETPIKSISFFLKKKN